MLTAIATLSPSGDVASAHGTAASEAVERPEPGLARGRWEAPAWVFYVVAAAALLGAALWLIALIRARRA